MDIDRFEERAAIMEFGSGMTRFEAETMAAEAQGETRWRMIGEISKRLVERTRDQRAAAERVSEDNMPGVQRGEKKEKRSMPKRDV